MNVSTISKCRFLNEMFKISRNKSSVDVFSSVRYTLLCDTNSSIVVPLENHDNTIGGFALVTYTDNQKERIINTIMAEQYGITTNGISQRGQWAGCQ